MILFFKSSQIGFSEVFEAGEVKWGEYSSVWGEVWSVWVMANIKKYGKIQWLTLYWVFPKVAHDGSVMVYHMG